MKEENNIPARENLDQAFHQLQDQITRITVKEEEEMMKENNQD
ncbi:hypothetical protein RCG23_16240 [Neobacillus sp. PS3-34]|nr:hypothetical protein [Neobacillus sp. PS3-34]WML47116.1 hypothetical protein RCG23_16240 [Neobacillus sp. PS3-34]